MHSKYSKEQHLKMNLMAWDEGHRYLAAKRRDEVLDHIPRADDPFAVAIRNTSQQLAFIAENTAEVDTNRWREKLENLQEALDQKWTLDAPTNE